MKITIANRVYEIYQLYEDKLNSFLRSHLGETDPRTSQWLFTRSPIPLLTVFTLYYMIAFFGPKAMKNRRPFEMRKVLMMYNIGQIWLSSFIMKEITVSSYHVGFSLTCQPVDMSMDPYAVRLAGSSWWYHISKYIDLLDTIFFVLRKKGNQMSFLHLFHHSTMLFNTYLGILYIPGGQAIVSTFLNSFVHVVMYWYYLLSAVGPRFHRFLWWKKYLTILQLTQFVTVLAHVFLGSFSGCEVPRWLKLYVIAYVSVLIVLFLNFYLASYKKMSLMKAVSCVCFYQNQHVSRATTTTTTPERWYSPDPEPRFVQHLGTDGKPMRRESIKAKSPFTVVSRNAEQRATMAPGDGPGEKDKEI